MSFDTDYLLKALDNENNTGIEKMNNKLIKKIKNDYLQKLNLSKEKLKEYHTKLKNYRYVDELSEFQYGRYIRWINLTNPEKIHLSNGGVILDIMILKNGIQLLCKNFRNQKFQIKADENLIFQKITDQENIILSALDFLEK